MPSLLFLIKTISMLLMVRGGFRVGYHGLTVDPTWLYDNDSTCFRISYLIDLLFPIRMHLRTLPYDRR